jgi:TonB family protein
MNVCGLVAVSSLLFAQASALNPAANAGEAAPMRVFRADTPGLQMPVLVKESNPELYAREDVQARVQGTIALEVTIGPDGRVRDAMITDGLPASPAIEERAVVALSEWRFQPARLNGHTVAVRTTVRFTMSLR